MIKSHSVTQIAAPYCSKRASLHRNKKSHLRHKNGLRAEKMTFFGFFFSIAHLHVETILLCFYQNFISSAVQINHGGVRKSVTSTNERTNERRKNERTNERTTNERTTWTIIIPRQDSQKPRANKSDFL